MYHTVVPDEALVWVWVVKSPCTCACLLELCHSAAACVRIKPISRMESSMTGLTSWAPHLPFPLGLWQSSHCHCHWDIWSLQHCSAVSVAFPCSRVSRCPSASSVSWNHVLFASPWLMILFCLNLYSCSSPVFALSYNTVLKAARHYMSVMVLWVFSQSILLHYAKIFIPADTHFFQF